MSEQEYRSETGTKTSSIQIGQPVFMTVFIMSMTVGIVTLFSLILDFAEVDVDTIPTITSTLLFQTTIILIVFILLRNQEQSSPKLSDPSSMAWSLRTWFIVYGPIIGFSLVLTILLAPFAQAPTESVYQSLLNVPLDYFLVPLAVVVLAPIAEELLFRKYLISGLEKVTSGRYALALSALIFSMIHWLADIFASTLDVTIPHAFSTLFLGFLLGFIYQKTRNVMYPIIIHAVHNGLSFSVLYLTELLPFSDEDLVAFTEGGMDQVTSEVVLNILIVTLVSFMVVVFAFVSFIVAIVVFARNANEKLSNFQQSTSEVFKLFTSPYLLATLFALLGIVVIPAIFIVIGESVGLGDTTATLIQLIGYVIAGMISLYLISQKN